MTVAEARAVTGNALELPPSSKDPNACDDVELAGGPPGVSFMVEGGRVVRVDVQSGRVQTAEGARIGDTEERVKMLYGDRVAVTPHKYTDGHYLTVRPKAVADSAFRIIFETDGHVVTMYRAGIRPPVEYVEGCA